MKIQQKTVYSCDHCNKRYFSKDACLRHEKLCKSNPENFRPCFNCHYLCKKNYDYEYYDGTHELNLLYCSKKNTFLHTPQVEIKGNAFDLGDDENNPMPKECNDFCENELPF